MPKARKPRARKPAGSMLKATGGQTVRAIQQKNFRPGKGSCPGNRLKRKLGGGKVGGKPTPAAKRAFQKARVTR